jgi:hypothetical protein
MQESSEQSAKCEASTKTPQMLNSDEHVGNKN